MGQKQSCFCCAPSEDTDQKTELQAGAQTSYGQQQADPMSSLIGSLGGRGNVQMPAIRFDLLISDLEAAEEKVYGEVFKPWDQSRSGIVPMDNHDLRGYLASNSDIEATEIDTELLKHGSLDEGGVSLFNFIQLMRDCCVSDTSSIEDFLAMGGESQSVPAEDCRSRLMIMGQRKFGATFNEDQWDRIFNIVMRDASVTVTMDQWTVYCKQVARICRAGVNAV
mmetsp:Transcript_118291/g.252587  ORF Transcript_118291/g.252587 Transcript_118291/m.252587 type:complete len:223 (-) Transcript_118291:78-746(-)